MADIGLGVPGLVKLAVDLVQDILRAREELKSAPFKIQQLVQCVEDADRLLGALEPIVDPANNPRDTVKPILQDLTKALGIARKKTTKYKLLVEKRYIRVSFLEVGKAFFCLGAARQNKRTEEVTASIRETLNRLHQALAAETFIEVKKVSKPTSSKSPKPAIVNRLDAQSLKSLDDEEFVVSLEHDHGVGFRSVVGDQLDLNGDPRRAAREGGYEVDGATKVRFEIAVSENRCFLYVVTYDNSTGTPAELFFPSYSSADHTLTSKFKRKFPDSVKFKHDPRSFIIESSNNSVLEQQSVYFVVTKEKLHADLPPRQLAIEDIQEKLESMDVFYVKKFIFDIVPRKNC